MSPRQILASKLTVLPVIELEERIKNELEDNPALDEGVEFSEEHDDVYDAENADTQENADNEDFSLGDYMSEDDIPDYKLAEINSREERRESFYTNSEQSLSEYLLQQLKLTNLSDKERKTGEFIIGNIDDDGYLRRDLRSLSDDIAFQTGEEVSESDIAKALNIIRSFDPPGIGATNLQECLLLQLERGKKSKASNEAIIILKNHFDDFSHRRFDRIQRAISLSDEEMRMVISEITSLNPKPGSNWDDSMTSVMNHITPDFIVENDNGVISMLLNNRGVPELRINREYTDMLRDYTGNKANRTADLRDAITFVKQKLDAAQGFIDAVKERQQTLTRTMEAIISLQQDFFMTGDESRLKPMILKDVAEKTGYDVSTISRVNNSKFVQTDFGVFPLKFFFSESTQTESGETISTRKVKQVIREVIDAENKTKPVTDEELTTILKTKGYIIARRTVAKYREQLGITVARMRREA